MLEDLGLCTRFRVHQHKLILFLSAMRQHAAELRTLGWQVHYHALDDRDGNDGYWERLDRTVRDLGVRRLRVFTIADRDFASELAAFCANSDLELVEIPSPAFAVDPQALAAWAAAERAPRLHRFWQWTRRRSGLLLDLDGGPLGGRWSFDADNREPLPRDCPIPPLPAVQHSRIVQTVTQLVAERFAEHPGAGQPFWLPTTRAQARGWLSDFLEQRFDHFGPFQDALGGDSETVFHSVLSPAINCGLLTPGEIVAAARARHAARPVPLASLEGFLRQLVGWRDFVWAVDRAHGARQQAANHLDAQARLAPCWWQGNSGIPLLDRMIDRLQRRGYAHHIERLMVAGNLMLLLGIHPQEAYRWFMELFVDSATWVMGPNVFGMALFADGGLCTTKPYACGSPYLRRMSGAASGPWCDEIDGLYWDFIERHRSLLLANPRSAQAARGLDRIGAERRQRLRRAAATARARLTI